MILLSIALAAFLAYLALRYVYSHWERNGLPSIQPSIPFGNLLPVAKRTESFGVAICKLYQQSTAPLLGIYLFFRPAILIRDASLAKRIMTSDFNSFHDRGVFCDPHRDPFSANLAALPGKQWRQLRSKLTPTFSSGKLRNMLPTILAVGQKLREYLAPLAEMSEVVEMRNVSSRYVVDIIATVFFGFEADSINDPEHPFLLVGKEVTGDSFTNNLRGAASFICPGILRITRIRAFSPRIASFMIDLVTRQMAFRRENNVSREDFLQLLIDLREEDLRRNEKVMSVVECAAQVNLFYIAGSETTSATITYTLHELTQSPAAMERVKVEVDEVLSRFGGEVNYDVVKELKYLDACVKETLRKYPGLPILNRECTEDFKVPDSDVIIRKGTQVIIPLFAYGMDERYFPEPEKYIPERFLDRTEYYNEQAYFPFGEGPRNCIGVRMGVFVAKFALVLLLNNYNFEATQGPQVEFAASSIGLAPKDGIKFKITSRKV